MEMINRHLLAGNVRRNSGDRESSLSLSELDEAIDHLQHDNEEDLSRENLLEPSRITVTYSNVIKEAGLKTNMSADVNVEPFEIKLGFRELEFFNNLNKNVQEFLLILNDENDDGDLRSQTRTSTTGDIDIDKRLR